MSVIKRKQQ